MDATSLPLIRLALRAIHLLPQGEKESRDYFQVQCPPSPLLEEGARRADEGAFSASEERIQ